MRIAYLEDDPDQAALVRAWLEAGGHLCHHFDRGHAMRRSLASESYDLYLLDWELPDTSGVDVMKEIRARAPRAPVIFTTARDSDEDVSRALQAGADDYIAKPVRRGELLARIEAVARRLIGPQAGAAALEHAPFRVDRKARAVERGGARLVLTDKEYALAEFFFMNAGRVVSRQHLLEAVWGREGTSNTRTVDTHISRLRGKLGLGTPAGGGWQIVSVHQFGYRLERQEADA
jgi:DNA-binding response OmpR family regulator